MVYIYGYKAKKSAIMAKLDVKKINSDVLNNYAKNSKIFFDQIGEHLQNIYRDNPDIFKKSKAFTKQISNPNNWSLKGVASSGLRIDSSKTSLKKEGALDESVYSAIDSNLATAIKFCKHQISLAKEDVKNNIEGAQEKLDTWEQHLKDSQALRALNYFKEVEAQSVVAEEMFKNTINTFVKQLNASYTGPIDDMAYTNIINNIEKLNKEVSKYSLYANQSNHNTLDLYSSDDTLAARKEMNRLCEEIKADLIVLNKKDRLNASINNQLPRDKNADYLTYVLDKAHGFAKTKNDVNYSNPTEISPFTAMRHRVTSALERISLVLGLTAIGSSVATIAMPIAAPLTGFSALVTGCIAAITGLSAILIKSSNAVVNYAKYGALPTKEEVTTAAIGAVAIGATGINQVGTLVTKSLATGTKFTKTGIDTLSEAEKILQHDMKEELHLLIKEKSTSTDLETKAEDTDEQDANTKNNH